MTADHSDETTLTDRPRPPSVSPPDSTRETGVRETTPQPMPSTSVTEHVELMKRLDGLADIIVENSKIVHRLEKRDTQLGRTLLDVHDRLGHVLADNEKLLHEIKRFRGDFGPSFEEMKQTVQRLEGEVSTLGERVRRLEHTNSRTEDDADERSTAEAPPSQR